MAAWASIAPTVQPDESKSNTRIPEDSRQRPTWDLQAGLPPVAHATDISFTLRALIQNRRSVKGNADTMTKITSSNITTERIPKDDLFLCLRPVLAMGQLMGMFPFGGAIKLNEERLPVLTRWSALQFWIVTMAVTTRTVISIVLFGLSVLWQTGVAQIFYRTIMFVLESICLFHVWFNTSKYDKLFRFWRSAVGRLTSTRENLTMRWKCFGMLILLFTLIFVENWLNVVRTWSKYNERDGQENVTFLLAASSMEQDIDAWRLFFGQPPIWLQLFFFIESKMALYAHTVMGIYQICLVVMVRRKFQDLLAHVEAKTISWNNARTDYVVLMKVVELVNEIISIQILPIMITNIYFTVSWVYMAICPEEKGLLDGVFTMLAVGYLLLRFILLCIPAGSIHEASKKIWCIIQQCPDKEYDVHAQRLERLTSHPLGIDCLGLFTINRSFVMSFLNAVFTLIIVRLQVDKKNTE